MKILILCAHNSVRSQLAEAIFRHLGKDRVDVKSAGISPCGVNSNVYRVLDEIGLDSRGLYSKSVSEFENDRFDYVITVCDSVYTNCPSFPGNYKELHFPIDDPGLIQGREEEILSAFRNTRDTIKTLGIRFLEASLDKANLKCPFCGFIQEVEIPQDKCLTFYECSYCQKRISSPSGSCCVICGYSDKVCREFYTQAIEKFFRKEL